MAWRARKTVGEEPRPGQSPAPIHIREGPRPAERDRAKIDPVFRLRTWGGDRPRAPRRLHQIGHSAANRASKGGAGPTRFRNPYGAIV